MPAPASGAASNRAAPGRAALARLCASGRQAAARCPSRLRGRCPARAVYSFTATPSMRVVCSFSSRPTTRTSLISREGIEVTQNAVRRTTTRRNTAAPEPQPGEEDDRVAEALGERRAARPLRKDGTSQSGTRGEGRWPGSKSLVATRRRPKYRSRTTAMQVKPSTPFLIG